MFGRILISRCSAVSRTAFRQYQAPVSYFSTFYTVDHEYLKVDGDIGTLGVSDFAQNQMGDVVYVGLPEVGDELEKG